MKGRYKSHKRTMPLGIFYLISKSSHSFPKPVSSMWTGLYLSTLSLSELLPEWDKYGLESSGTRQDFWAATYNCDSLFSLKAGKYYGLTSLVQSWLWNTILSFHWPPEACAQTPNVSTGLVKKVCSVRELDMIRLMRKRISF